MKNSPFTKLIALILALAPTTRIKAQAFTLATSFGNQGAIYTSFGEFENNFAHTLLPSPDGKVVLGANGFWQAFGGFSSYIKLVKFSPLCGSLDNTFGNGGQVYLQFDAYTYFNRMAIQDDGKIVGVGLKAPGGAFSSFLPFVCRLNADGTVDSSFSAIGYYDQRFDPVSGGEMHDLHIYPDGKILVIGNSYGNINGGQYGIGLLRFLPDGQLDNSFSDDGKMVLPFYGGTAVRGAVTESGDIYVASRNEGSTSLKVFKYFDNGVMDTVFGEAGMLTYMDAYGPAMVHKQDGKLLIAADVNTGVCVGRINLDGTIDSTFGTNGFFNYGQNTNFIPKTIFINNDQSILVGGMQFNLTATVLKLSPDGSIDSSFGSSGFIQAFGNIAGSNTSAGFGALYMPNDSTIYGSGYIPVPNPTHLYTAKFISGTDDFSPLDLGADLTACSGTSIELNPGSYETYAWNTGSAEPTLTVSISGTYAVTVSEVNGCGSTDSLNITFNEPFVPEIFFEGNSLTATGEGTFIWLLNGDPIPNANANSIIPQSPGAYSLEFTDLNGCISVSNSIIITTDGSVQHPFLRAYPNPADQMLQLQLGADAGREVLIQLIDLSGRIVLEKVLLSPTQLVSLDIAHIAQGMYTLRLRNSNEANEIRIVKK